MNLHLVEQPSAYPLGDFFHKHHPFSLRLRGSLDESGDAAALWVDDPAAPRLAVHVQFRPGTHVILRKWLLPVGEPDAVLAHLDDLETLSAEANRGDEDEGLLKLSSLPPALRDAVAASRPLVRQTSCGLYTLQPGDFRPCREGPPAEPLRDEDAPTLAALSEYGHETPYCLARIRNAPTAAVRIEGELASFMIVHSSGDIGMLRTLDKFRNRRLARSVVTSIVEQQFDRGKAVFCYIVDGNTPSQRVFLSLGFRRVADAVWAAFEGASGRKD